MNERFYDGDASSERVFPNVIADGEAERFALPPPDLFASDLAAARETFSAPSGVLPVEGAC